MLVPTCSPITTRILPLKWLPSLWLLLSCGYKGYKVSERMSNLSKSSISCLDCKKIQSSTCASVPNIFPQIKCIPRPTIVHFCVHVMQEIVIVSNFYPTKCHTKTLLRKSLHKITTTSKKIRKILIKPSLIEVPTNYGLATMALQEKKGHIFHRRKDVAKKCEFQSLTLSPPYKNLLRPSSLLCKEEARRTRTEFFLVGVPQRR